MLGGFSIDEELFNTIRKILPIGDTILELGSGEGTKELCKFYNVYSIEQDSAFLNLSLSTYIYAPLREYKPTKQFLTDKIWYDREILSKQLPKNYGLILIDGPIGANNRTGFWKYRDMFNLKVPIIFDDSNKYPIIHMANLIARVNTLSGTPTQIASFHGERKSFTITADPDIIKKCI